ncbi:putative transposable element [Trichonephila clavipes]|uniref:Putative transposable element n=1 Tax=Trichonephila clavipes TaxID=2585209 RepID=A0A8X6WHM2_TRICX|nr:putative transposable element [Trichonephila clavipes]
MTAQRYVHDILQHMCCPSCNGSQKPFFNKTMLGLTRQGCHKTVSLLLPSFLGLPDSQIFLQSSISEIIGTASWASHDFQRTRGKVAANMERNVSRDTELVCLNARSYRIVHSSERGFNRFGLAVHQNDHQARRRFVEWAQNEIAVVPDFHKRILFSDEAHFWLNGYVNKQNCRIWSEANPQVYVETPLHPVKLTVWCALWAGGIIGPYFFKNDEGHNVTVNGDRYRAMITNFFIPELNNHDVQELWFQQDGATCHTARATIDLLKDTFGDRLISRFGPVNWPPRSCDFTPLDYFLWGYVKSLVYADKPQTLDHLEDNIRRVIADIRPQMLEKVIENWTSRLDYIRASRGSPMPEIIFKIHLNGRGSLVADVVESLARNLVPLKLRLQEERCTLNLSKLQLIPLAWKNTYNEGEETTITTDLMLKSKLKDIDIHSNLVVLVKDSCPVCVISSSLVPLKIYLVERLMHIKSVEVLNPLVAVVKFEEGCRLKRRPRYLTRVQNNEVRRE